MTVSVAVRPPPEAEDAEPGRDLVFDFSEMDDISVHDLSVLLTAQRLATEEDRAVWAAGVQVETWHALHAMGLGHYFRPFPTGGVYRSKGSLTISISCSRRTAEGGVLCRGGT
jgi:hypothetical protein